MSELKLEPERCDELFARFYASVQVDVRGRIQAYAPDVTEFSLDALVKRLRDNAADALRRKRLACLHALVFECMIPFYEEQSKLDHLCKCPKQTFDKKKILSRTWLKCMVIECGNQALMGMDVAGERTLRVSGGAPSGGARTGREANVNCKKRLHVKVLEPLIEKTTTESV
eukprot:6151738-Pleurochrysis_carterae.AAC.1